MRVGPSSCVLRLRGRRENHEGSRHPAQILMILVVPVLSPKPWWPYFFGIFSVFFLYFSSVSCAQPGSKQASTQARRQASKQAGRQASKQASTHGPGVGHESNALYSRCISAAGANYRIIRCGTPMRRQAMRRHLQQCSFTKDPLKTPRSTTTRTATTTVHSSILSLWNYQY